MVPEQHVLAESLYHCQRPQYVQLKKYGLNKLNVIKLT